MKHLTHDEVIAAHDAPRSTRIDEHGPYIRVTVRYPNASWFILTLDKATGLFALLSDWGNYIHSWPLSIGESFDEFIFGRADGAYLAEKMMTRDQRRELDIAGTNEALEEALRGIFDDDEDGEYDEDQLESDLKQLRDWSTEDELREMTFYLLEDYELQDNIREKETFRYAVFTKLIVPTFQKLWAERQAQAARVAADNAMHAAMYPQHAKFAAVDLESRAISEFMDFLDDHHYLATGAPTQKMLIGEFYEIDVKEFDNEKDRMVAVLQAQAAKEKTP